MRKDDDDGFSFLIFLLFGLICIFMEFRFLEDDTMKFKVFFFIAACISFVICIIGIGLYIFSNEKLEKEMIYIASKGTFKELKEEMHVTHLIFDENTDEIMDNDLSFDKVKYVKTIDFYANDLKINTTVFNKCKRLEEINFYTVTSVFCENVFAGCTNLKAVNFYGDKKKFQNLKLNYPKGCEIHFIPYENLSVTNESPALKEIKINAELNINDNGKVKKLTTQ